MRALLTGAIFLWILAVSYGFKTLWTYQSAPGEAARAPVMWPADTRLPKPLDRPALVMLLHPQCACSQATIAELGRLVARTRGSADVHVLFVMPAGASEEWAESDLWQKASAIPGVRVVRDDRGVEARRFGAATSGETLVYDESGRLQFSGGITAARGHEGDNAGRAAVEAILRNGHGQPNTATFGCALLGQPANP